VLASNGNAAPGLLKKFSDAERRRCVERFPLKKGGIFSMF
jgi:hypothetical protein